MEQLRLEPEDRRRPPGVARVIAVASGKGGVGKSTVTVNLALALAARGRRVGILDADVHGPNIPYLLGVRRRAVAPPAALLALAGALRDDDRPQPLERYGLRVLSLALFAGEEQHLLPGNLQFAGAIVRRLLLESAWGGLDALLIDRPPGPPGAPRLPPGRRLRPHRRGPARAPGRARLTRATARWRGGTRRCTGSAWTARGRPGSLIPPSRQACAAGGRRAPGPRRHEPAALPPRAGRPWRRHARPRHRDR